MKTYLKIPFERAPEDPVWLSKAHAGRKLDPIEVEEFMEHKYQTDYQKLVNDKNFDGVPGYGSVSKAITQYHYFKAKCLLSSLDCGSRYNKKAFAGPYDECGAHDVFGIWKKNVNEKRAKNYVSYLMEHYDFPIYHDPPGLLHHINIFY